MRPSRRHVNRISRPFLFGGSITAHLPYQTTFPVASEYPSTREASATSSKVETWGTNQRSPAVDLPVAEGQARRYGPAKALGDDDPPGIEG
jgi:hypothetical protein